MEAARLAREIVARLRTLGTEERRNVMDGYAASAMEQLGVSVPDYRPVVKDVAREIRGADSGEVLDLARALIAGNTFEGRQAAYELLSGHETARSSLDQEAVIELGRGIDNWASVDTYAVLIAGIAWREDRVSDDTVHGWTRSDDRWWRRAALVCTVALNQKARGGTGDPDRTIEVCRRVVRDRDDMVAKALSWALRELSKREPERVRDFLDEHEAVLAKRVLREVRGKLTTGRKP